MLHKFRLLGLCFIPSMRFGIPMHGVQRFASPSFHSLFEGPEAFGEVPRCACVARSMKGALPRCITEWAHRANEKVAVAILSMAGRRFLTLEDLWYIKFSNDQNTDGDKKAHPKKGGTVSAG